MLLYQVSLRVNFFVTMLDASQAVPPLAPQAPARQQSGKNLSWMGMPPRGAPARRSRAKAAARAPIQAMKTQAKPKGRTTRSRKRTQPRPKVGNEQNLKRTRTKPCPTTSISISTSETSPLLGFSSSCNSTSITTNSLATQFDLSSLSNSIVSSAPLIISSSTTNLSLEPPIIDALSYVSDVFDNLFAHQVSGPTPLHKSIRVIMVRRLLLDHAAQELLVRTILSFDDLYNFIIGLLQRTRLLS